MARRVRPVAHEDELSLVEHLDGSPPTARSCSRCRFSCSSSTPTCCRPSAPKEKRAVLPVLVLFPLQLRARDYYGFFSMTMLAGAIVFQLPLAILAITRPEIRSVEQLSSNRRYAYLAIAAVAAALPGVDPVSMIIEMVPLLVLFELSILLAKAFDPQGRRMGEVGGVGCLGVTGPIESSTR